MGPADGDGESGSSRHCPLTAARPRAGGCALPWRRELCSPGVRAAADPRRQSSSHTPWGGRCRPSAAQAPLFPRPTQDDKGLVQCTSHAPGPTVPTMGRPVWRGRAVGFLRSSIRRARSLKKVRRKTLRISSPDFMHLQGATIFLTARIRYVLNVPRASPRGQKCALSASRRPFGDSEGQVPPWPSTRSRLLGHLGPFSPLGHSSTCLQPLPVCDTVCTPT